MGSNEHQESVPWSLELPSEPCLEVLTIPVLVEPKQEYYSALDSELVLSAGRDSPFFILYRRKSDFLTKDPSASAGCYRGLEE